MEKAAGLSALKGEKLKDTPQWRTWFARIKLYAKQKKVWDLCNPDTDVDDLPEPLEEPDEPEYPDGGDSNEKKEWRDLIDVYKIRYSKWEKQTKGLDDVNEYIVTYLDPIHHISLLEYETPYERLVYLRDRFARSTAYEEEIRMKWRAFAAQKPSRGTDIDGWLTTWNTLREHAVSFKLDDAKSANRDFLQAVKDVLPIWWQGKYQEIIMDKTPYETRDLVESFRAMYREIGPKNSVSVSTAPFGAFSTWQGYQEAKPEANTEAKLDKKKDNEPKPYDQRVCPCGRRGHRAAECYTLNESARPTGWRVNEKLLEKANKALAADPGWKKWVDDAIKDANAAQSTANAMLGSFSTVRSFSATKGPESPYKSRWIFDTATTDHVCNDRSRFITFEEKFFNMATGDASTPAYGIGTAKLTGRDPLTGKERSITLSNVSYSPSFHASLLSYGKLKEKGGYWCQERDWILDQNRDPLLSMTYKTESIWLIDEPDIVAHAYAVRHSVKQPEAVGSEDLWHRRFGHINQHTVKKLGNMVDGISVDSSVIPQDELCAECHIGRAPRQISRRPVGRTFGRFGRIHFDLIQLTPAYNNHVWISHFYVEGIRFHWLMTHHGKWECQSAIKQFIQLMKNWWNLPIKAFYYDNEVSAGKPAERFLTDNGIIVYHSPPAHPEMNGYAERAGGVIILRMRMLMLQGKLPKQLWPEAAAAAVWLLNRTPTYLETENRWIVPWEEVRREFAGDKMPKINLSNVRLYGSLAYCRIQKLAQLDKMHPRAEIGFLVGYVASNVWKIWFPHRGKVEFVRDVIFDESRGYHPGYKQFQPPPLPLVVEPKILDESQKQQAILDSVTTGTMGTMPETERRPDEEDTDEETPQTTGTAQNAPLPVDVAAPKGQGVSKRDEQSFRTPEWDPVSTENPEPSLLRTDSPIPDEQVPARTEIPGAFPEDIPLPPTPPQEDDASAAGQGVETNEPEPVEQQDQTPEPAEPPELADTEQNEHIGEAEPSENDELEQQLQAELTAPSQEIIGDVDTGNIVSGRRKRKARQDDDYAAYGTLIKQDEQDDTPVTLQAFATGLYAEKPDGRHHRDDLPDPPKHWKDVMNHPFQEGFLAAMRKEIDSLKQKGTYEVVERPRDRGKQVLPLMWVFTYKFDENGYLLKFKARICVRGDLETISSEEKRAATLAARTARMIFALVAAFDLDVRQRDAVTAFLNSLLNKETYTRMPEGFETPGKCWKLVRALYGLRISPRLWQQEAAGVLMKLGLRPVPEDPCVFVGDGILVFFYVDDILIVSHRTARERAQQLERDLEAHWELTDHGEAAWFLNIRILRDRQLKKLWLCQDSYITSVAVRYNLTDRPPVFTPLPVEALKPYEGTAGSRETYLYQQKVGSAQYATTITRPDAAKATALLAQFLTNPGPQHHQAIDRVISYLYTTRYQAIEYSAECGMESVRLASDSSYADHADRKSSAGYICQVYGGPVDWKATKQRTVTTSTTEAELLGLSETGKNLQWWRRLLDHVGFAPSHVITIGCDNERAIGLLTSEDVVFDTKLRHVDIHHHWLRQEVREGRIKVSWVPTTSMVADGLTKLLPRQKHENFVRLLRMADIGHLIG